MTSYYWHIFKTHKLLYWCVTWSSCTDVSLNHVNCRSDIVCGSRQWNDWWRICLLYILSTSDELGRRPLDCVQHDWAEYDSSSCFQLSQTSRQPSNSTLIVCFIILLQKWFYIIDTVSYTYIVIRWQQSITTKLKYNWSEKYMVMCWLYIVNIEEII